LNFSALCGRLALGWFQNLWKGKTMDHISRELNEIAEDIVDDTVYALKRQVTARVMLLFLLPLFFLVSACGNEKSNDELNSVKSRFEYIDKRLDGLEGITKKLVRLEKKVNSLEQTMTKVNRSLATMVKTKSAQKKAVATIKKAHHTVLRGDNLSRIAKLYGLSVVELCRLNQITPKTIIRPGQKLIVSKASGKP
jgi:LysM repeat protein